MGLENLEKHPLGSFTTRCEENGRIRISSPWIHFFTHDLKDNKVFSTSLDGTTIRVYPESIWRANLALFQKLNAQSADVQRVLRLANHFGAESAIENHGKILIKPELRNKLGIVGTDVVGTGANGVIFVHRKADHDSLITGDLPDAPGAVLNLTLAGMS